MSNVSSSDKISYGFISLFNPTSIKNLTLYQRNAIKNNISSKLRGSFRNYKILVKQSYLMSAWFYYYSNKSLSSKKVKGFVTLPCRVSKHTAIKSPMAHKTFSQEQFIIKYYYLSFTLDANNTSKAQVSDPNNINLSLLKINNFLKLSNFNSTNMLILYKIRGWFSSTDLNYFRYK
jgi:hypothetical protein